MKKIHPSSAAFMWGESVITGYSSGCLRQVLLGSRGVRTDIPDAYMRVGAAHEEQHEAELKADAEIERYDRESVVKLPVPEYADVMYSGRIDFECWYKGRGLVIHETKGTISKSTRLDVLRKGKVKINQLAQLVSYMIARATVYGKLVCGYYEQDGEGGPLVKQEERVFKVFVDGEGKVLVDGEYSGYTVFDQMAHRQASARVVLEGTIEDRPAGHENKWGGPCAYCTFKSTCDRWDLGALSTVDEFVSSAQADVEIGELNKRPDPVPHQVKHKKPAKGKGRTNGHS